MTGLLNEKLPNGYLGIIRDLALGPIYTIHLNYSEYY